MTKHDLTDLTRLHDAVDRLQSESDKATGAYEHAMKRLKAEFNCKSIEEAERMLKRFQKEAEEADAAFDHAMSQFKKKWGEVLCDGD